MLFGFNQNDLKLNRPNDMPYACQYYLHFSLSPCNTWKKFSKKKKNTWKIKIKNNFSLKKYDVAWLEHMAVGKEWWTPLPWRQTNRLICCVRKPVHCFGRRAAMQLDLEAGDQIRLMGSPPIGSDQTQPDHL